jgi:trimeric autotransporter adhesin
MGSEMLRWIMVFVLAGLPAAHVVTAEDAPRILAAVDASHLTPLLGNVSPRLKSSSDLGVVPSNQNFDHVYLVLSRSTAKEAELTQYLDQLQDKSSANYHRWLTPEQYGQRFGVATSDLKQVKSWLSGYGLVVNSVSKSHMIIDFSGTAVQLESAFHVTMHNYSLNGETYAANLTAPQIPTALATVVKGVARLDTRKLRPHYRVGPIGMYDALTKRMTKVGSSSSLLAAAIKPDATSSDDVLYVTPADAATIYDTPNPVLNVNYSGDTTYDGTGVTIGIGGASDIDSSYVEHYRTLFLGETTPATPTVTIVGSDPGVNDDATEAYLDLEVAAGLAPKATLHYYESSDLTSAIEQAMDDNAIDIFSLSYGDCEWGLGSYNATFEEIWKQAATQGIAVTVSTGDAGSAGCDNENSESEAYYGLQVNGLASTPYNVAVGGTDYDVLEKNFSDYVGSTNSRSSYYRTAEKYIPENPWDDSTAVQGPWADNTYYYYEGSTNIIGGGGGHSACITTDSSDDCAGGYAKPSWQRGATILGDGARDIPDVSLLAADGTYGATWLICGPITTTSGTVTGCDTSAASFYYSGVGGTSASTPAFAGMLAQVEQSTGSRLGQVTSVLYSLAASSNGSAIFHDVTYGNNSVACASGYQDCTTNTAGDYFLPGYDAGTGYDLATGLGSVDVVQLINYWSTATSALTPSLTIAPSTTTPLSTDTLTVNVSVSGSGTTPGGTVTLTGGDYTSSAMTLSNGAASFSIAPGNMAAGTVTLAANYSGDANYGSASSSVSITVTKATPTVVVVPASSDVSATDITNVTVNVQGAGRTPSGNVTLVAGSYSSTSALTSGAAIFSVPAADMTAGSVTLTATYAGDDYYQQGSGTATIAVSGAQPTISISPANTTFYGGESQTVSVALSGSGITPSGSVTLSGGGYTSAATALSDGTATITIPGGSLSAGVVTLSASYSGDSYYRAAIVSTSVTVKVSDFTVSAPSSGITVSSKGSTATGTITVTSANGFSGSVNLACSLTGLPSAVNATYLPTCSIESPVTLAASKTSATATLSISTTATTTASSQHKFPWQAEGGAACLAFVFLCGLRTRRRELWKAFLLIALAIGTIYGVGGCGGITKTPISGTTSGAYTFTVTATNSSDASSSSTAAVTVTVP